MADKPRNAVVKKPADANRVMMPREPTAREIKAANDQMEEASNAMARGVWAMIASAVFVGTFAALVLFAVCGGAVFLLVIRMRKPKAAYGAAQRPAEQSPAVRQRQTEDREVTFRGISKAK